MKLRKDLIKPPRLYFEDEKEERHANWLELLFDLIFVAAFSLLALDINSSYSFTSFLESVPLFFVIWWGWLGHTIYLSRFGTDDLMHRFYTMAQMIVVAFMAINAKDALGSTGPGFALFYALLRFMLVAEYVRAGKNVPETRPLTHHYSIGFGLAAFIWVLSAFVPPPWRFLLWILAIIVDLATPLSAGKFHKKFPLHPTHLPERFGLLTIILIGETVVGVVYLIGNTGLNISNGIIGILGLLIAFSIWWGYFEEARGAEARAEEKGEEIGRYQLWLYAHFPLLLGIAGTAIGIKHVLILDSWEVMPAGEVWLLCLSLGLALVSLSLIFLSSFNWKECISKVLLYFRIPYYVIIFLVVLTGFLGTLLPGSVILGILTLLSLLKVILSFREPPEELSCPIY
ncbi:MAG: low temperature requirement protein A [Methanobacteriaceae archaeon]|nr:low temperature requirement protein A [Methanobacteriaceae archaeon]